MVVCLCKGVSDKMIQQLVKNGAGSLRQIVQACQAGTDCGSCLCQVRELIERTKAADAAPAAQAAGSDPKPQDSSLRICCAK
jgi:bacterioferritin-associated ferredoxin